MKQEGFEHCEIFKSLSKNRALCICSLMVVSITQESRCHWFNRPVDSKCYWSPWQQIHAHHTPGTVLSTMRTHLTLMTILWRRHYYHHHFTAKKMKAPYVSTRARAWNHAVWLQSLYLTRYALSHRPTGPSQEEGTGVMEIYSKEDESPTLWPHNANKWLIWKHPDAGKDWRPEEKGTTEAKMVGWHHRLNGHEFE